MNPKPQKKPKSPSQKRAEKAKARQEWTDQEIAEAFAANGGTPKTPQEDGEDAPQGHTPGARSKWPTIDLERVEALAAGGLTKLEIAKSCKIGISTFCAYQNDHPEFLEAIERGRARTIEQIENAMRKVALGYVTQEERVFFDAQVGAVVRAEVLKEYPPDVKAQHILLQKHETGSWRPKPDLEIKFPEPLVLKSQTKDHPLESLGAVAPDKAA